MLGLLSIAGTTAFENADSTIGDPEGDPEGAARVTLVPANLIARLGGLPSARPEKAVCEIVAPWAWASHGSRHLAIRISTFPVVLSLCHSAGMSRRRSIAKNKPDRAAWTAIVLT